MPKKVDKRFVSFVDKARSVRFGSSDRQVFVSISTDHYHSDLSDGVSFGGIFQPLGIRLAFSPDNFPSDVTQTLVTASLCFTLPCQL